MSRNYLPIALFSAGLAVLAWIGLGTFAGHPLGAAVTALVAACYLAGAHELWRYRQATATQRDR